MLNHEDMHRKSEEEEQGSFSLKAIYLGKSTDYDITLLGAIVAEILGLHLADATAKVRYCRGAFLKNVDHEVLQSLEKELRNMDMPFFTLPMTEVISVERIYNVGKVKIEDSGFRVYFSGYREKFLEWDKIGAIHFITLHKGDEVEKEKKKNMLLDSREQKLTPKALDILENLDILKEKQYNPEIFFDLLYLEGPSLYRFHQRRLSYPFQEKIYPHSLDNFLALFENLASRIPQEKYTAEASYFLRELEKEALKREKKAEKKGVNLKREGSLIDRVRILDETLFFKIEELQNYYDWLIHQPTLREKIILPKKEEKEPHWQPLTKQESRSWNLKWPFIVGILGSIYIPLFLYAYGIYQHSQNKIGLPTNVDYVQNMIFLISFIAIALIWIGSYFGQISKLFIGSVVFMAITTIMTYPAVLVFSGEFHFRGKEQKMKLLSQIRYFQRSKGRLPHSLEELNHGKEILDPWGAPWHYRKLSRGGFELKSFGPDRKLGTPDDI